MFGFYKKVRVNEKAIDQFLECIKSDSSGLQSGPISKTSWNTGGIVRDELGVLFDQYLRKKIERKVGKVKVIDLWYQIYDANSGSFHDWHIHPHSDYSITFYVQMKRDKNLFTQFRVKGKTKVVRASVGDCVIFNSSIVHKAPSNLTDVDKIIVSANLVCDR